MKTNPPNFTDRKLELTPEAKEQHKRLKKLLPSLFTPSFWHNIVHKKYYPKVETKIIDVTPVDDTSCSTQISIIHDRKYCWYDKEFKCPHTGLPICPPGGCMEMLEHLGVLGEWKKEEKKDE